MNGKVLSTIFSQGHRYKPRGNHVIYQPGINRSLSCMSHFITIIPQKEPTYVDMNSIHILPYSMTYIVIFPNKNICGHSSYNLILLLNLASHQMNNHHSRNTKFMIQRSNGQRAV